MQRYLQDCCSNRRPPLLWVIWILVSSAVDEGCPGGLSVEALHLGQPNDGIETGRRRVESGLRSFNTGSEKRLEEEEEEEEEGRKEPKTIGKQESTIVSSDFQRNDKPCDHLCARIHQSSVKGSPLQRK